METALRALISDGVSALNRLADTIQQAVDNPNVEIEIPPPRCPHCNEINPQILVSEAEARGPLGEFIVLATCLHCNRRFYGYPAVWATYKSHQDAVVNAKIHLERMLVNGSDGDAREASPKTNRKDAARPRNR